MSTKVASLLYGALDNDSRAKRAFSTLHELGDLSVFCDICRDKSKFPYVVQPFNAKNRSRINGILWMKKAFDFLKKANPEVIYAEGLLPLAVAGSYKLYKGAKIIFDARELVLKDEKGKSTYSGMHRTIERSFIPQADIIFCANEKRSELMAGRYNLSVPPTVIRNIPPPKSLADIQVPESLGELLYSEKKVVVYQGRLNLLRDIDKFIYSMPFWKDRDSKLLLVVEGKMVEFLKKEIERLDLNERVTIHPFLAHDVLYKVLSKCDLGIITYDSFGPNNNYCAPNKLYEYAQVDLPMVTSPQFTFSEIFSEFYIGKEVPIGFWQSNNYEGIAQLVDELTEADQSSFEFNSFNAKFQWKNEELKFKNAFQSLVGNQEPTGPSPVEQP